MRLQFYEEIPESTHRVFLRTDYNVPIKKGKVQDTYRIKKSLGTIHGLLSNNVQQIVIGTHMGRPDGREEALSTRHLVTPLSELLDLEIHHVKETLPKPGDIPSSTQAKIVLLENLRFNNEEVYNENSYAKRLANLADIYVNDAFGVSHRKHASVDAITQYLPSFYGELIKKEVDVVKEVLDNDSLVVILGGSKLAGKLPVIHKMTQKAQRVYIGGKMMLPFISRQGHSIGKASQDEKAERLISSVTNADNLVLPTDVVVADTMEKPNRIQNVSIDNIPQTMYPLDIGKESVQTILEGVVDAEYVVWNGPLGYYENSLFAKATNTVLDALKDHQGKVIIGGGDTANAVHDRYSDDAFYHVSTGGGAFLTLLKDGSLPTI